MGEFTYKLLEDDTYCVMGYEGDEKNVVIPDIFLGRPVSIIYDDLFRRHAEIESVKIPDSVTDIGGFVFENCVNLRHLTLPANLRNLWQYAFVRSGIEEIVLPPGVLRIFPYTFKECRQLKKVVCNPGLKEIGPWAFGGCDHLTEFIHAPETQIDPRAFEIG